MPVEFAGSYIEKVIELLVTPIRFQKWADQLPGPPCSVFDPSFLTGLYVTVESERSIAIQSA